MRKIISLILITLLLFPCIIAKAEYEMPESIRVGLYFGSSSKPQYTVSSSSGFKVTGGGETYITEDESANSVTVIKDSFYHAAIDGKFDSADEAFSAVTLLKENSVPAFFVLDGSGFSVFAGRFNSDDEAEDLKNQISALGFNSKIVSPPPYGVLVLCEDKIWTGSVSSGVRLIPLSFSAKINDKEYRGFFEFYRDEKSDMAAVNVLGTEDYLKGVVPREVSASWHTEAVKAQAIVARTYAVTNMNKFKSYGFNVDDTVSSQVYGGVSSENELTNKAVDETAGKLVMYDSKPAEVFFFSSSGGATENVENVWGGTSRPYLVSVPDTYENAEEASYSSWTVTLSPEQIREKLASLGVDVGEVLDVTIDEQSSAGRSLKTTIHGSEKNHTLTFEKPRNVFGLYSNMFTVTRQGGALPVSYVLSTSGEIKELSPLGLKAQSSNAVSEISSVTAIGANGTKTYEKTSGTGDFIFTGKGWGHGIGMSQWGAKGMAEAGFLCDDIIKHYFVGTEVY